MEPSSIIFRMAEKLLAQKLDALNDKHQLARDLLVAMMANPAQPAPGPAAHAAFVAADEFTRLVLADLDAVAKARVELIKNAHKEAP